MVRRNFLSRAPVVAHEYLLKKKKVISVAPSTGQEETEDHEFDACLYYRDTL